MPGGVVAAFDIGVLLRLAGLDVALLWDPTLDRRMLEFSDNDNDNGDGLVSPPGLDGNREEQSSERSSIPGRREPLNVP